MEPKNGAVEVLDEEVETPEVSAPLLRIETELHFIRSFEERPTKRQWCCSWQLWRPQVLAKRLRNTFESSFPIIEWLPKYKPRELLLKDLLAGTTLAFVIAPKAMGHSLLGGLPPVAGIYTVFCSTLVYGFMGLSKWLSLGTAALPALLFGDVLTTLNLGSPDENAKVAPMLTLYIAIFTWVLLIFRLDRLVVLIPPAVLSAFATTAAFLIATSQIKYVFGVHLKSAGFAETYVQLFSHISETNVATLVLWMVCMAYLLFSKYIFTPKIKKWGIPDCGAMVVVLASVALVAAFDLDSRFGIEVAGPTPSGLPPLVIPWKYVSDLSIHRILATEAFVIAVINFVLAITVAKNFARKSNSVMKVSQELKALAAGNTMASFFGAMIAGGSFSGSAIVASLKVESLVHNFVNSFVMALILLVLTPMVEILPKSTLAAIIIAALPSLVDFQKPFTLWSTKKDEFVLWVCTFFITLFFGVQYGIIAGASLSLIVLTRRNIRMDCTEIGVIEGTTIYRSLERFPAASPLDGILIFRLDQSLNFANFEKYEDFLEHALAKELAKDPEKEVLDPRFTIILSCEAVNDIDTASIEMLCRFAKMCEFHKVNLVFSGWKYHVRQTLRAANIRHQRVHRDKVKPSADSTQVHLGELPLQIDLFGEEKSMPAPLAPSKWYLNLHDAVLRAQVPTGDFPPENQLSGGSSDSNDSNHGDELMSLNTDHLAIELPDVAWPIQSVKSTTMRKCRTQSSPVVSTTEIMPSGETRDWNYISSPKLGNHTQKTDKNQ